LTRGINHEIDRRIEAPEIDTEMGQIAVEPDRKHALRTVANRLGVQ